MNNQSDSKKITIGATGDILLHDRVYKKAKSKKGYNFTKMLENAKPLFKEEHLNIVNQESIIGGKELGISSFPHFNSPIEIAYTLQEMNVDIINMANNHVLDKGEAGILSAIKNLEAVGIPYIGAYKSKEDKETLRIFHKNGLKICFLAYTKSMGIGKRPKNKKYLVDKFNDLGVKWIRRLIGYIKKEGLADIVILSMHFGKEYQFMPTSFQTETSYSLSDTGADVIIGHHPHVLQPPAYIVNSKGQQSFVAYSLGNFFTGQKGIYRQIGAHMSIDIEKVENDPLIKIKNPKYTLTFVDPNESYKLHLLKDIVNTRKEIVTDAGIFNSEEVYEKTINHMLTWIPDLNIS